MYLSQKNKTFAMSALTPELGKASCQGASQHSEKEKDHAATRKRKTVHLSLFFLWIEASHYTAQDEGK